MLGVAWGVGGLAVPLVGMVGDAVGLQAALMMLGVLPAVAAVLTLRLPERASHADRVTMPARGSRLAPCGGVTRAPGRAALQSCLRQGFSPAVDASRCIRGPLPTRD